MVKLISKEKKGKSAYLSLIRKLKDPQAIRNYYQKIISCMPNNVYWLDRNCITQGCNDNVLKLVGLKSLKQFVGITYEKMGKLAGWTEDQAESFKRDDMEVMTTGIAKFNVEEPPLYDEQGNPVYYMSSRVPLFNQNNEVIGVVGISVDITERKKNEQALKKALERAEAANRAKTIFLANLSHDIKTPLAGIISTAENLTQVIENPVYKKRADDIVNSGLRLLDFLIELIEISRFGVDDEILRSNNRFKLKQLIDDLVQLVKPAIGNKSLALEVRYDDKIPNFLIGNRSYLYRIILNLLSNAIKFTNKGNITIKINLEKMNKKNIFIKISVKDTGIGIPKDKQETIFERFTRLAPSYEGIYKGSGLGLYIVSEFIKTMGGEIYVDSKKGKGSTFTCLIPLEKALLQTEDNDLAENENFSVQNILSNLIQKHVSLNTAQDAIAQVFAIPPNEIKILLVEDDAIAVQAVKDNLQSFGCHVDVATTGKDALNQFEAGKYNLIYMDIGLPDMSGIDVTKKIRKIEKASEKRTPIIALSAHVDADIKSSCFDCGMNGILAKPLLREQATKIFNNFKVLLKSPKDTSTKSKKKSKIIDLKLGATLIRSDIAGAKEMLKLFMEELPETQRKMEQAYRSKNIENLIKLVHKMHGALCYCGAPRLKHAAKKLETILKTDNLDQLDKSYRDCCFEITELIDAYKHL